MRNCGCKTTDSSKFSDLRSGSSASISIDIEVIGDCFPVVAVRNECIGLLSPKENESHFATHSNSTDSLSEVPTNRTLGSYFGSFFVMQRPRHTLPAPFLGNRLSHEGWIDRSMDALLKAAKCARIALVCCAAARNKDICASWRHG
jgi:hypothetical protein